MRVSYPIPKTLVQGSEFLRVVPDAEIDMVANGQCRCIYKSHVGLKRALLYYS